MPDIEILRLIWWALMGVLLMGFAISDGFDLGIAAIFPFVARNEMEREIVLHTIRPVWEGNQVWIILGAGAIFAAWPLVYAAVFSGFYFLILILLLTMGISRPVSFKYRSKLPHLFWRRFWDHIVWIGGLFPSIIFGILIGNVFLGLPFSFDADLRITGSEKFSELFSLFPLWCGLTSLFMLIMHGGLYLAIKTNGIIRERALYSSRIASILLIIFFAIGGLWITYAVNGYILLTAVDPLGASNPLHKVVISKLGAWILNYSRYPIVVTAPALGFLGAMGVLLTARRGNSIIAFICSSLSIIGIIGTVGVTLFPFILPSSAQYMASLLIWDASSSHLTLLLMLFATVIFLPIILFYTAWVYRTLRGKVTEAAAQKDS